MFRVQLVLLVYLVLWGRGKYMGTFVLTQCMQAQTQPVIAGE